MGGEAVRDGMGGCEMGWEAVRGVRGGCERREGRL